MNTLQSVKEVKGVGRRRLKSQHRNIKLMTFHADRKSGTNLYLSDGAKRKLVEDCGFKAAFLHSSYSDKSEDTNDELTDEYMAGVVGWPVRAVARYRNVLAKSFWFRKETIRDTVGKLGASYYLLDQRIISEFIEDNEFEYFEDFIKNRKNLKVLEEV